MRVLRQLNPAGRTRVTDAFRTGASGGYFDDLVEPFSREVDLDGLHLHLATAEEKFKADAVQSDAWLAPRLHGTLRLTRREASNRGIWDFLGLVEFPGFVRWRWRNPTRHSPAVLDRFIGNETKQAFARLWWGAELTRNGPDYTTTELAFRMQSISNAWQRLDAFHHRPTAIAAVRFLGGLNAGATATDDQVNALAKSLNMIATTVPLSAVVTDLPDADALDAWIREDFDPARSIEEMPVGPPEAPVPDSELALAESIIRRAADDAGLTSAG